MITPSAIPCYTSEHTKKEEDYSETCSKREGACTPLIQPEVDEAERTPRPFREDIVFTASSLWKDVVRGYLRFMHKRLGIPVSISNN